MKYPTLTLALLLCGTAQAVAAEQTSDIMHEVYDAIAYLLPLSVRDPGGETPWDKELVDAKLDVLTKASSTLVKHAEGEDADFSLLARSFDRLVQDTAASFRKEWPDYAYYSLLELTDHCVACHSRRPSESQDVFGQRMMARMNTEALTPEARAMLYVATRQFDAALALLEQQLLDPQMDPVEADYRGLTVQYLRIAILTSIGGDLDRIKQFIDTYRKRDDLPYYLDQRLDHWRKALTRLTSTVEGTADLKRAIQIFDHSTGLTLAPGNRVRAVEDFVAARLLRANLENKAKLKPAELADIYYRLGIIALRTSEPEPAVPEMEMLFAAAIQADPTGPHAREAYSLLEEYGYIHEEHLARQGDSAVLLDMAALRKQLNGAAAP